MTQQQTLNDMEHANKKRTTKRESFLKMMNEIVPWSEWVELIRPFYPKGEQGRPPLSTHAAYVPFANRVQSLG